MKNYEEPNSFKLEGADKMYCGKESFLIFDFHRDGSINFPLKMIHINIKKYVFVISSVDKRHISANMPHKEGAQKNTSAAHFSQPIEPVTPLLLMEVI